MLPTHHRDDIHEDHAAGVDPQATCHYPLGGNQSQSSPQTHQEETP